MNREDRSAYIWLSLIPLLLALPCFFGYTWAEGDLIRQFHPWKELGRQAIQAGRWPLWNPYVYCGMPLLGNFQSGLAYPLHLPFYFFDFAPVLGWHLGIHFLLSGLGFYALARALGLDRGPALLAALAWQCNAFLLARVEFMSALSAYAWTPWILFSFAAGKHWSLSAAFIGLQALAGYPLELGYCLAASALLIAILRPSAWKQILPAYALGLVAGSLVLIPGLELLQQSSRLSGGIDAAASGVLTLGGLWQQIWPSAHQPWTSMFSLALPSLALVGLARGRAAAFGVTLALLGLVLSLGLGAAWLPNRHPSLALILAAEGLALLTGLGAQGLQLNSRLVSACALLIVLPAAWHWLSRGDLASSSIYAPAQSASYLAARIEPHHRILISPEIQNERDSTGHSVTEANAKFSAWLQSNTAAPLHIRDANGYDPLAPAAIVDILNQACFPRFGQRAELLDLLGVEAIAQWDPKLGRFHAAISKRKAMPFRAARFHGVMGLKSLSSIPEASRPQVIELDPETLQINLPERSKGETLLVNDTYFPGWKAEVDGRAAQIEQSLGAFRTLRVSEGSKVVTMRYRPTSVFLGFALSLLAWAVVLYLGFKRSNSMYDA